MKYSKEQQEAINTIDGQVCIISVAGSGKTSVIVARANNIIKSGVRPYRILVLTRKPIVYLCERCLCCHDHLEVFYI